MTNAAPTGQPWVNFHPFVVAVLVGAAVPRQLFVFQWTWDITWHMHANGHVTNNQQGDCITNNHGTEPIQTSWLGTMQCLDECSSKMSTGLVNLWNRCGELLMPRPRNAQDLQASGKSGRTGWVMFWNLNSALQSLHYFPSQFLLGFWLTSFECNLWMLLTLCFMQEIWTGKYANINSFPFPLSLWTLSENPSQIGSWIASWKSQYRNQTWMFMQVTCKCRIHSTEWSKRQEQHRAQLSKLFWHVLAHCKLGLTWNAT